MTEPNEMTDRELLVEIVQTMRTVAAALKQLSESPMMSMFGSVKL